LFSSTRIAAAPSNPRGGHYPPAEMSGNLTITRGEDRSEFVKVFARTL
jgi:hypothetical protein